MPITYIGNVQKSKSKQKLLYSYIKGQIYEQNKTLQDLAEAVDESKQNFCQKFKRMTLQPWELLIVFHELGIEAEQLKKFELN